MSPELIAAIKERIAAGQSREEIEIEVIAMGHSKEVFTAAYTLALHDNSVGAQVEGTLPSVTKLFSDGWSAALTRLDLTLFLAIPLLISTGASFWFNYDSTGPDLPPLSLSFIFAAVGAAYLVVLMYALFSITRQKEEESTPQRALAWVIKHFLPLVLIYVLSGLAIVGGFIFFFIPGLVVLVMVTFAQFVYVAEGKRGMAALLGSRALVSGRFFTVAGKILGFALLSLLPAVFLGIVTGMATLALGEGKYVLLVSEFFMQVFSAFLTVVNLFAMFVLYQALATRSPEGEVSSFTKIRYWSLVALALSFITILILMSLLYKDTFTWIEKTESAIELPSSGTTIPAEFSGVQAAAEEFHTNNSSSYTGVCAILSPLAESAGAVVCNESEQAWALMVTDDAGESFCTDTTTPGKKISVEIGENTECFAF